MLPEANSEFNVAKRGESVQVRSPSFSLLGFAIMRTSCLDELRSAYSYTGEWVAPNVFRAEYPKVLICTFIPRRAVYLLLLPSRGSLHSTVGSLASRSYIVTQSTSLSLIVIAADAQAPGGSLSLDPDEGGIDPPSHLSRQSPGPSPGSRTHVGNAALQQPNGLSS